MIISHKYKYVCINPPKTGTGFRENLLKNHSDINSKFPEYKKLHCRHWNTSLASKFLKSLKMNPDEYFWFTIVRDPVERIVSWVNMIQNRNIRDKKPFVDANTLGYEIIKSQTWRFNDYIYRDGRLVDFIGSIENISADTKHVISKLQIDINIFSHKDTYIHNYKSVIREELDTELIDLICETEKEVIEMKGYNCTSHDR